MTKQKYIGIENELISFDESKEVSFRSVDLEKVRNEIKYYLPEDYNDSLKSDSGNLYYIDCCEIEIATPPIPLNKGFATRVTNSLIIGRNQIIKNTPDIKHTGYSMHWNLTASDDADSFYEDIAIPFQLFGLTPMSCGCNVNSKDPNRFEIAGDSLTNEDQIRATALLLGAYSLAKDKYDFPIEIYEIKLRKLEEGHKTRHMLKNGRYTTVNARERTNINDLIYFNETQIQNIIELFYDWLSPFVYKLGEREEINNLEAFIKGDKKLEMDDVKYFYKLEKEDNILTDDAKFSGKYKPIDIPTPSNTRSQVIKLSDNIKMPLEGRIWQKSINNKKFEIFNKTIDWHILEAKINNTFQHAHNIEEVYIILEKASKLKYKGTLDYSNIIPEIRTSAQYNRRLINNKLEYNPGLDDSAIIEDNEEFNNYLTERKTT